ncbi:HK97 gp10 family phage protein [Lysinibacillus sp. NPDC097287]|uniref:HK97 gp10 family phage protein n=1 Tax=Lysinibacillus sp. NPDC097287 TaxID=3364144 RepID=UPI0037FEA0CF
MATPISGIADAIARELQRYSLVLKEDVDKATKEVSKETVDELKNGPLTPRRTGDYAASWRMRKVRGKWVVHSEDHYRLTHLLEKGHAKVGGGRVRAYKHIQPAAEKAAISLEDKIDEIVRMRG